MQIATSSATVDLVTPLEDALGALMLVSQQFSWQKSIELAACRDTSIHGVCAARRITRRFETDTRFRGLLRSRAAGAVTKSARRPPAD